MKYGIALFVFRCNFLQPEDVITVVMFILLVFIAEILAFSSSHIILLVNFVKLVLNICN